MTRKMNLNLASCSRILRLAHEDGKIVGKRCSNSASVWFYGTPKISSERALAHVAPLCSDHADPTQVWLLGMEPCSLAEAEVWAVMVS